MCPSRAASSAFLGPSAERRACWSVTSAMALWNWSKSLPPVSSNLSAKRKLARPQNGSHSFRTVCGDGLEDKVTMFDGCKYGKFMEGPALKGLSKFGMTHASSVTTVTTQLAHFSARQTQEMQK